MPPNTFRVHTEYVLVKSVGPKSCGLSHERRDWRIFHFPSVPCKNCGGGDRGCRHLSSFGEIGRAKSHCYLHCAQGQEQAYFHPLSTMNFVGLDLTRKTGGIRNNNNNKQINIGTYQNTEISM
ncbi:uncharacterized protein TNCV_744861 [Trichonephila clavipes]|nr:uncharacterized protein TNCV_744861 [Trichonephila clavipes]